MWLTSNMLFSYFALCALVLGVIFGSFLNALLFRFNTGKGMGGRSRCMRCNHTLHAFDLIPLLSYAFLRGKCRYCGTRISLQYPLVEAVAALLSLGCFFLFYPSVFLYAFWFAVWMVVLFIFVYDLRHMIIPWSASLTLLALALVSLFIYPAQARGAVIAGVGLALPLFLLSLVSRGRWMGWADSLLELSLGMLLGLSLGLTGLMFGVWSGALVGVALIGYTRFVSTKHSHGDTEKVTMHSEIPFAPFLAFGAMLAFFFHVDLFSTLSLF